MAMYSLGDARIIHPGDGKFWVAANATVVGNVHVGEDASIWFNAVIRSELEAVRIGARSNVQDGSVLHTDPGFPMTIGEGCTIGHMVMLHDRFDHPQRGGDRGGLPDRCPHPDQRGQADPAALGRDGVAG